MLTHHLDMASDAFALDLFAEELPEQVQLLSDCLSTASTGVCGLSTFASIVSTGESK